MYIYVYIHVSKQDIISLRRETNKVQKVGGKKGKGKEGRREGKDTMLLAMEWQRKKREKGTLLIN